MWWSGVIAPSEWGVGWRACSQQRKFLYSRKHVSIVDGVKVVWFVLTFFVANLFAHFFTIMSTKMEGAGPVVYETRVFDAASYGHVVHGAVKLRHMVAMHFSIIVVCFLP